MGFTPEALCRMNPSYKSEVFKEAFLGKEHLLTYSLCSSCGMIYCENIWDDEVVKKVYEDSIDHHHSKNKTLTLEKRLDLIRKWETTLRIFAIEGRSKIENLKVVDYGCGWGDFLDVVWGSGVEPMGFDEDRLKVQLAKKRGHRIASDIEELRSFAPVDVFMMNAVIEHLQDVKSVLDLVKELLKPNGLLVMATMDYRPGFIKKNMKQLKKNRLPLTQHLNPVEHVNVYDYASVMKTLDKFGFRLVGTDTVFQIANSPIPFLRNNRVFIRFLNRMEQLSSRILTDKDRPITLYAKNLK